MYLDLTARSSEVGNPRETGNKKKFGESLLSSRDSESLTERDVLDSGNGDSSTIGTSSAKKECRESECSKYSNELKKDLGTAKGGVLIVNSSAPLLDMNKEEDIPTEMDRIVSHKRSVDEKVSCGSSIDQQEDIPTAMDESMSYKSSVDEKVCCESFSPEGRIWLEKYKGCWGDPEIVKHLRTEAKTGTEGFSYCLSFIQNQLKKERQANKKLEVRINDDKLMLKELLDEIRRVKAKFREGLDNSEVVSKDEVKLTEKPKSSLGDVCTPETAESGAKTISEDQRSE